jgi:hypothetical protein
MSENERPQSSADLPRTWSGVEGYFLPKTAPEDIEVRASARTFLMSHLFGPPLGLTVPLALYLLDPDPSWDVAVLAASIVLFWVFPFLLRRGVAYDKLVLLSVVNLNFCTLFSCYANGGITSSTLIWILLIPILSLFYVGGTGSFSRIC